MRPRSSQTPRRYGRSPSTPSGGLAPPLCRSELSPVPTPQDRTPPVPGHPPPCPATPSPFLLPCSSPRPAAPELFLPAPSCCSPQAPATSRLALPTSSSALLISAACGVAPGLRRSRRTCRASAAPSPLSAWSAPPRPSPPPAPPAWPSPWPHRANAASALPC